MADEHPLLEGGEIESYRVEPDPEHNCEWHVLVFKSGRQVHIHTDRPLVIVEPERH